MGLKFKRYLRNGSELDFSKFSYWWRLRQCLLRLWNVSGMRTKRQGFCQEFLGDALWFERTLIQGCPQFSINASKMICMAFRAFILINWCRGLRKISFILDIGGRNFAAGQSMKFASCRGGWGEHSAQGWLRRFNQWPRIEHPTFQLRGAHSTTALSSIATSFENRVHV